MERAKHSHPEARRRSIEGVVANEALCMRLAAAIGILTAKVEACTVEGMDYLLVERYDRFYRTAPGKEPVLERLHQEDSVRRWESSLR
jgi:serine/threonine-protein kinase HipA